MCLRTPGRQAPCCCWCARRPPLCVQTPGSCCSQRCLIPSLSSPLCPPLVSTPCVHEQTLVAPSSHSRLLVRRRREQGGEPSSVLGSTGPCVLSFIRPLDWRGERAGCLSVCLPPPPARTPCVRACIPAHPFSARLPVSPIRFGRFALRLGLLWTRSTRVLGLLLSSFPVFPPGLSIRRILDTTVFSSTASSSSALPPYSSVSSTRAERA